MPHISNNRRKPATTGVVALLALLIACIGLAACGGSSKSSSTATHASVATTSSAAGNNTTGTSTTGAGVKGAGAKGAGHFLALRECLQKNGITLPSRPAGGGPAVRRGGTGGFLGGGAAGAGRPALPKGVTRAQYEAVLKKCGGGAFRGGPRANSPAFRQALVKFAACMRENGVKLPEPNNSGKGPIFDTKGVNTASTQFRAAERKCSASLRGAFGGGAASGGGAGQGAAGAPGHAPGGAPPAGG